MAHSKQAMKRIALAERQRVRNRVYRSTSRTLVTQAEAAIASGDRESAEAAVLRAIKMLDRTASKRVIHQNNAARRKSRLVSKLNAMSG